MKYPCEKPMTKIKKTDPNLGQLRIGVQYFCICCISRPDNILRQHSVDHNDHGPDQFKSSAEKQKVRPGAGHNHDREAVLRIAETKYPAAVKILFNVKIFPYHLRGTQSTTRRQAMRKRTRDGQSCMFSLNICAPRNDLSRIAMAK